MISLQETSKKPTVFANLLKVLMAHQHTHLSTIYLLGEGILSPAAGIARLKAAGVQIDTLSQTVLDANGVTHKNVAAYKIVGGVAP